MMTEVPDTNKADVEAEGVLMEPKLDVLELPD
jgi:hypothetical protein